MLIHNQSVQLAYPLGTCGPVVRALGCRDAVLCSCSDRRTSPSGTAAPDIIFSIRLFSYVMHNAWNPGSTHLITITEVAKVLVLLRTNRDKHPRNDAELNRGARKGSISHITELTCVHEKETP